MFDIDVRDIPRGARLCMAIYAVYGKPKTKKKGKAEPKGVRILLLREDPHTLSHSLSPSLALTPSLTLTFSLFHSLHVPLSRPPGESPSGVGEPASV